MPRAEAATWKQELEQAVRDAQALVLGWENVQHRHHARLIVTALRAFGDDPRATFFVEVLSSRGNIPRPDLILLHPEVGVVVVENKGIRLDDVEAVEGSTLVLVRDGRIKGEDPFLQAERVAFRLRDQSTQWFDRSEALFLSTVAMPAIGRADFETRYGLHWPAHAMFAHVCDDPARFRAHLIAYATECQQRRAGRGCLLSKRASDAVKLVLSGRAFLHAPRRAYVEAVDPACLGAQIQELELGTKEPTAQQRELGGADLRGQHRLFRGVAGSGKSVMLALSAALTLGRFQVEEGDLFQQAPARPKCVLVACFNRTLVHYLRQRINDRYARLTWDRPAEERLRIVHFDPGPGQLLRRGDAGQAAAVRVGDQASAPDAAG